MICVKRIRKTLRSTTNVKSFDVWHKYYNLDIPIDKIACDGCRSKKKDAKLIDEKCPVRKCVVSRKIDGCFYCKDYPCDVYGEWVGLCYTSAKNKLSEDFLIRNSKSIY